MPRMAFRLLTICALSVAVNTPALALSGVCKLLGNGSYVDALLAGADTDEVRREYSNGVYFGHMHEGKRCGFGGYYWNNGTVSFGIWDNGTLRQGIKIFP